MLIEEQDEVIYMLEKLRDHKQCASLYVVPEERNTDEVYPKT